MGMYSHFSIAVEPWPSADDVWELECELNSLTCCAFDQDYDENILVSCDEYKWRGYEEDMVTLSSRHPNLIFTLVRWTEDDEVNTLKLYDGKILSNERDLSRQQML